MLQTGASPTAGGNLSEPAHPRLAVLCAVCCVWLQARQRLRDLGCISTGRDKGGTNSTCKTLGGLPSGDGEWRLSVCGHFLGQGMPGSLDAGRGRKGPLRASGGSVALGLLDLDLLASRTGTNILQLL